MIPLLIAAGLAAGSALAAGGAGAAGVGKNPYRASNFGSTDQYDEDRFNWGGKKGVADKDAKGLKYDAWQSQQRRGEKIDYTQANTDRSRAGVARANQTTMALAMKNRALGNVPSLAEMEADRQMRQATAAQASAAASARGAGGLALAQQNAAGNTAAMQSAISNQAQINAAQERMAAEQAAYNAYSGIRQGDLASQQQSAAQAQAQAQINAAQRAANDQYSLGLTGYQMGVRQSQLNADMQQQAILAQSHAAAQGANMNVNQANANREMDFLKMGMGMAQGSLNSGLSGRAAGGPVQAGTPYIVGELGPELIVPMQDGTVIPHDQTMGLLGGGAAGGGEGRILAPGGGMDVMGSLRKHASSHIKHLRPQYNVSTAGVEGLV